MIFLPSPHYVHHFVLPLIWFAAGPLQGVEDDRSGKVVFAIAQATPISASSWRNLESLGVLDDCVAGFLDAASERHETSASLVASLRALEEAKTNLNDQLLGHARCVVAIHQMQAILKVPQSENITDEGLRAANDVLTKYLTDVLPPLPGGAIDSDDIDLMAQAMKDFKRAMAGRRLGESLIDLRILLYRYFKRENKMPAALETKFLSARLEQLMLQDLKAESDVQLYDALREEYRKKCQAQPLRTDYKSDLPPDRSRLR